jgi:hypothetical protein
MTRSRLFGLGLAGAAAAFSLAATQPGALAPISGGLWEISGLPGAKTPLRQCVADVVSLAQFEHRGRNCSREVITDAPSSTVIQYSCGSAGFGRSQVDVVTPRSLRISTQGISDNLPFNYVLQARRIGDCQASAARH